MRRFAIALLATLAACGFSPAGSQDLFPCDAGSCNAAGSPVPLTTGGSATGAGTTGSTGSATSGGATGVSTTASAGGTGNGSTGGLASSGGTTAGASTSGGASSAGGVSTSGGSGSGGTTTGGSMTCPSGKTPCGAACVDTSTDSHNCGICGYVCPGVVPTDCVTGACDYGDADCLTFGIAANSQYVAWATQNGGVVWNQVQLETAGEVPASKPLGLAMDSTNFYWTDLSAGTVNQAAFLGGGDIPLATGQINPAGLAIDANNVYWTTLGTVGGDGTVMSTPIAPPSTSGSGLLNVLASGQALPFGIAVASGSVYWQNLGTAPSYRDGAVMVVQTIGGLATPLAQSQVSSAFRSDSPADTLEVDASYVYWIANGDVMWLQIDTGATASFGIGGEPEGIAIDATHLYYTLGSDVMSEALPPGSGSPVALATGQSSPGPIAAGPDGVYWGSYASTGMCAILAVPPP